jgi:hypothetical protein
MMHGWSMWMMIPMMTCMAILIGAIVLAIVAIVRSSAPRDWEPHS